MGSLGGARAPLAGSGFVYGFSPNKGHPKYDLSWSLLVAPTSRAGERRGLAAPNTIGPLTRHSRAPAPQHKIPPWAGPKLFWSWP